MRVALRSATSKTGAWKTVFAILALATSFLIALIPPGVAAAAPTVNFKIGYDNAFPDKITFSMQATSSSEISKIKLNYRIGDDPASTNVYPEFRKGSSVSVEHVLNVQKYYFPPDSDISFFWEVETVDGGKVRGETKSFTATDTRFQWRKVDDNLVSVRWYKGDDAFAKSLLTASVTALDQLGRDIGAQPKKQVRILIYASNSDLLGALEPGAHEWTGGRSFSEEGIIVIDAAPTASGKAFAARAVPHELSHVVVHQATDNPYGDIPRWLDEGLAMNAEGTLEESYADSLEAAINSNQLLSLKTLSSNFPSDSQQAHLSYAESQSVVAFMLRTFGRERMGKLLEVFSEGSTYDDALLAALDLDMQDLENQWRASLGLSPASPNDTPSASSEGSSDESGNTCNASLGLAGVGLLGTVLSGRIAARKRPRRNRY